ncbi:ABC transporter permease [Actinospica sp.]|jgi:ABC-type dipeptide/oligopeptide/nickel transport system permease subunit|uniref:ABC transporter permease n=1 Tax=Actinospica sp. TaxID=1872142 RepID=UPI002C12E5F4|nr:ABC transporter permease [Actinospica sp.]HWG26562.1 ABC transporter permease [Actinospica sp.]
MTLIEDAGDASFTPEVAAAAGVGKIEGRSLSRIAWNRFKKDRVAVVSGIFIIVLIVAAIAAPLLSGIEGSDPYTLHTNLIDPNYQVPIGGGGGISGTHWLGIDMPGGRDLFSRVIYGARISLMVAGGSTVLAIIIGVAMGMIAGYFGGWIDAVISRTMDVLLAFPLLLFAISLAVVINENPTFLGFSGLTLQVGMLWVIIGFFSWPYMGRIIRGQVLALREREFVDAARVLGAKPSRILVKELLPNLVAPIIIYATLLIPTNILFEAALSFLGVGIQEPTASWGLMLDRAINYYQSDPEFLLVPGIAIFLTVLAFNLLGDGLRDALDPKASR